jgi:predicted dehydrogenase
MKAAAHRTRWGILGTSTAAQQFALGLAYLPHARLVTVGARTQFAADAFGEGNWVPRRYGAYEALLDDPDVDVVYVATALPSRTAHIRQCLQAGKAVVCDIPLATDAAETTDLIAFARQQQLLLMAGMWMRFLPLSARVRSLLAEKVIGQPQLLIADISLRPPFNAVRQTHDEPSAGQALLEAGAYLVTLASMVFGVPARVVSQARVDPADGGQIAATLAYESGELAALVATTRTPGPQEATISGEMGWIRIHPRWWAPEAFTLTVGVTQHVVHMPVLGNGASYLADEAMRCLRAGQLESELMPLDETLAIARMLDQMREQEHLWHFTKREAE